MATSLVSPVSASRPASGQQEARRPSMERPAQPTGEPAVAAPAQLEPAGSRKAHDGGVLEPPATQHPLPSAHPASHAGMQRGVPVGPAAVAVLHSPTQGAVISGIPPVTQMQPLSPARAPLQLVTDPVHLLGQHTGNTAHPLGQGVASPSSTPLVHSPMQKPRPQEVFLAVPDEVMADVAAPVLQNGKHGGMRNGKMLATAAVPSGGMLLEQLSAPMPPGLLGWHGLRPARPQSQPPQMQWVHRRQLSHGVGLPDLDGSGPAALQAGAATDPGQQPFLASDLPGSGTHQPRPPVSTTSSLDSHTSASSVGANRAGRGLHSSHTSSGWQGSGMPGGSTRDSQRRGSRGSFNNLASAAAGGAGGSGNKAGYAGRNGHYGGRVSTSRASMDDLMMAQVGDPPPPAPSGPPPEVMPATDLERFITRITPVIQLDPPPNTLQPVADVLQSLCLDDLWRYYQEPSLYGREVYTLGGARGPSQSYYVPYLSAMQLFLPGDGNEEQSLEGAGGPRSRTYISETEGWPRTMRLLFELFEAELPFNRHPLYEQLERLGSTRAGLPSGGQAGAPGSRTAVPTNSSSQLGTAPGGTATVQEGAGGSGAPAGASSTALSNGPLPREASSQPSHLSGQAPDGGQGLPGDAAQTAMPQTPRPGLATGSWLHTTRLSALHPASWFCVAWYPVYRIPDAPLNTRFLTFHSFAPVLAAIATWSAALHAGQMPPPLVLRVPIVGLKWNNMHGERWLEPLALEPVSGTVVSAVGGKADSDGATSRGGAPPVGRRGGHTAAAATYPGGAAYMDAHFQAHLSELQATAERLARGHSVKVRFAGGTLEDCRQRHPDFEFFNSRA